MCFFKLSDADFARLLQRQEIARAGSDRPIQTGQLYTRSESNDFACGFFVGIFFGIWAFLFIYPCRNQYRRSRKFKLGVLFGVLCNLILEIFQSNTGGSPTQDENDENLANGMLNNTMSNVTNDSVIEATSTMPFNTINSDDLDVDGLAGL